jgi:hypothetical protein
MSKDKKPMSNPAHAGLFTKKAKEAGYSVHAYGEKEKHAPGKLGKEAREALVFESFAHRKKGHQVKR